MGIELGRISGPLLSANLLRHGADLAFETDLLYLDVITPGGRIGVKTTTPNDGVSTLKVAGTTRTSYLITDTQTEFADLTFVNYRIQNGTGGAINIVPDQSLDPTVVVNELQTDNLSITNRSITNFTADSDINLAANGTGNVRFNTSKVNVYGSLHSTGDITLDGNITIGSGSDDNVNFNADVDSNIVPNIGLAYDLGTDSKQWKTLYSDSITTDVLHSSTSIVNGIDLLFTANNTIYVSVNGSDSNTGTHLQSTFRTVKHALATAQTGTTILVFPGTYEEDFPLTVPQGVTVSGSSIRAVKIVPTVGTNDKDAFLLNGETTVAGLTVSNFYYNSTNNTGYAFRLAPGAKTTSRSPYVQNVSVITRGSIMTPSDPLGFDTGDAGAGALVDGSVVDPDSKEATILFHSATFIVPNATGIMGTNGARIEWLNSFTYFAQRGIYLTEGTLGFASLGLRFGAEMRSIGSANVYGTYGAVADGANTLGYLIGHNFGYIGSDADSQNDYGLVVQANEIVAINDGKLYYDSMDHKGDYRVGDVFYINQQTGQISFNAQNINFLAGGSIVFEGPSGTTIIDARKVQVSNIRIYDNTVSSLAGPVNWLSASGSTFLNTDVTVTGNLAVTGDVTVGGNVFLGDNPLDTVKVYPRIAQDLKPDLPTAYNLGVKGLTPKVWNILYDTAINVDDIIDISNNTISTLTTDTDLKFIAAGTGKVQVTTTDVQVDNNLTVGTDLTVNGVTSLKNTVIEPGVNPLTLTAGLWRSKYNGYFGGNSFLRDDTSAQVFDTLTPIETIAVPNFDIFASLISVSAQWLGYFRAPQTANYTFNATGTDDEFYFWIGPKAVAGYTTQNADVWTHAVFAPPGTISDPIPLTAGQYYPIRAQWGNDSGGGGTENTFKWSNDAPTAETADFTGLLFYQAGAGFSSTTLTLTGNIGQTGDTYITGLFGNNNISVLNPSSYLQVPDVKIINNQIQITDADTDLNFTANGTGGVVLDSRLKITNSTISNVWASASTDLQKSIEFSPNGTGSLVLDSTAFLTLPYANNSNRVLSSFGEIRQNSSTSWFEGYLPSGNVSFNNLYDVDKNTFVTAELTTGANDDVIRFGINGTVRATIDTSKLYSSRLDVDSFSISGNTIRNTVTDEDIIINPLSGSTSLNGIRIDNGQIINDANSPIVIQSTGRGYVKFAGSKGFVIPFGNNAQRPLPVNSEIAEMRYNTQDIRLEVFNGIEWIPAVGTLGAAPLSEVEDILDTMSIIFG